MKVLLVGEGGRAIPWTIGASPRVERVDAAPGNPGIARLAHGRRDIGHRALSRG